MSPSNNTRCRTVDREVAVRALTEALGVRQLNVAVFDERAHKAYEAVYQHELIELVADLVVPGETFFAQLLGVGNARSAEPASQVPRSPGGSGSW
ncbi:DUF1707 SHOCT-like domain-containing protein [Corynebacterium kozikiae]|uniref:DUF1707 SHOCT-like domain-containing protein n=1 Tax=Corynebacterium kozikiae TaxID=2968469 RepID=UPI00211BB358|nr:DUF1707 domain-containing protein [Corynebacterium sp. 76QC2CO]MCQ9342937.1 DUF1707 domain-containing protein [Corynebacterium sp. 76QC2CO]